MLNCLTAARVFELMQSDFSGLLHLLLLFFANWLFELPMREETHQIVVIGDQFGLGVGDSVLGSGLTGLCNKLQTLLNSSNIVKLNWAMFNKAEFEATSSDWLVTSPKRLFQRVFENRKYSKCGFVVVMLGSQDYNLHQSGDTRFTPDQTFQNIVLVVEALKKLKKHVIVSYIPNPESWDLKKSKTLDLCFAYQVNAKLKDKYNHIPAVTLGPLCDISNYKYFRSDFYDPSRPNFNKKGYSFFAGEMFDIALPKVVKYELNYLLDTSN